MDRCPPHPFPRTSASVWRTSASADSPGHHPLVHPPNPRREHLGLRTPPPRQAFLRRLVLLRGPTTPARALLPTTGRRRPRPLPLQRQRPTRLVAWSSRLFPRWFQFLHAGHARLACRLRSEWPAGPRLRLPHGPPAGAVSCLHRLSDQRHAGTVTDARPGRPDLDPPRTAGWRRGGRRSRFLLLCSPGDATPTRRFQPLSCPSASYHLLQAAAEARSAEPSAPQGRSGLAPLALAASAGPRRSTRRVR